MCCVGLVLVLMYHVRSVLIYSWSSLCTFTLFWVQSGCIADSTDCVYQAAKILIMSGVSPRSIDAISDDDDDDNEEDNNILNLIQLAIATFATWPHCLLSLFDRRALTLSRRAHWVKLTHSHSRADSHINIIVIITRHYNRHINHDWWRHHFSITNIHLSWSVQCILYMNSVYYTQYNTNTNIHNYSSM